MSLFQIKNPFVTKIRIRSWQEPEPHFVAKGNEKGQKRLVFTQNPTFVLPLEKSRRVHGLASTFDSLLHVFPNAIAIGSPVGPGKTEAGRMSAIFIIAPILCLVPVILFLKVFFVDGKLLGLFWGGGLFFGWYLITAIQSFFMRRWLCAPKDFPIVFNRKTRTVTYMPVVEPKFWKFWDIKIDTHFVTESWDKAYVRSYSSIELQAGGTGGATNGAFLKLLFGEAGDDTQLKDVVMLGYKDTFRDERLWALWEHIRRYMEEGGPAVRLDTKPRKLGEGKPIIYPPELIQAAGGEPLSDEAVLELAKTAPPVDEADSSQVT